MRKYFKLHHRKHTGKLIHHRHTSYWVLVLLTLISTGIVTFIDRTVNADTLVVSATIPAPIPADPAVFISPANNSVITESPATVTGSCPVIAPAIIVAIYNDSELLGSSVCGSDGTFTASLQLQSGPQMLVAKVVTITGQFGASSTPLTLNYSSPVTTPIDEPLSPAPIVRIDTPFIVYRPGLTARLKLLVSNGLAPYDLTIRWGDNTTLAQALLKDGEYSFEHTYASGSLASQIITLTIEDAAGHSVTRSIAATNLVASQKIHSFNFASVLDSIAPTPTQSALVVHLLLVASLLLLWRFEHLHYRKRVGIPVHYSWQHKKHGDK